MYAKTYDAIQTGLAAAPPLDPYPVVPITAAVHYNDLDTLWGVKISRLQNESPNRHVEHEFKWEWFVTLAEALLYILRTWAQGGGSLTIKWPASFGDMAGLAAAITAGIH